MSEPLLLLLLRDVFGADATLSRLSIGSRAFCYVCEDEDRGLEQRMGDAECRRRKIKKDTAIPVGTYRVSKTWSPKFERMMYLLHDVPGFQGIRIHKGNDEGDTWGCLLPGFQRSEDAFTIWESVPATKELERILDEAEAEGREIRITITRDNHAWTAFQKES